MVHSKFDVVVLGAGAMGLAAAYHIAKSGRSVCVLEASPIPGGMAAHFDFNGVSLERYYHFVCKTDTDTFDLMDELGLGDKIVWRTTRMGYFVDGELHDWGNPIALLKYPHLNLIEKFRYGLMAWWCTKRRRWGEVESMTAPDWFRSWLGESCYDKMWRRLLHQKLFHHTEHVSATWIATRIQRIGRSRASLMQEELGHITGGTQTLVDHLIAAIERYGGDVNCAMPVKSVKLTASDEKIVETANDGRILARQVISTVPTPLVADIFPDLSPDEVNKLTAIENIAVVCLVFKLKRPVTGKFWLNIIDQAHEIPGLIEFSALRDFGPHTIIYAPYYMPIENERWHWSDRDLLDEAFAAIQAINPDISRDDVLDEQASRLRYSQPICTPNFLDRLPEIETSIAGVQIADTSYYYPEDRGISESVGLAKKMANTALAKL
ncbi:MAG: NAD(P)/FAD-dependent oxidoreductase [Pseudomonadota bacterium]